MKGHKRLELRSAGERTRAENSWTFVCECGAQESTSTKAETLREWNHHIASVKKRMMTLDRRDIRQAMEKLASEVRDQCRHAAVCAPVHHKTPEELVENVDIDSFVDRAMEAL